MMSRYRADLREDIPRRTSPKRVIFYAQGLKMYGLLPYMLNRRVGGQFRSNETATLILPTGEPNYTIVPYRQSPEAAASLLDWLYSDAGFRWGIAVDFHAPLLGNNALNLVPDVLHQAEGTIRDGFSQVLRRDAPAAPADVLTLLKGCQ